MFWMGGSAQFLAHLLMEERLLELKSGRKLTALDRLIVHVPVLIGERGLTFEPANTRTATCTCTSTMQVHVPVT